MRQSEVQKAIASLEREREAIDLAIAKLRAQIQTTAKSPRPRSVAPTKATA